MKFLQKVWDSLDSNFQSSHHLLLSVLESKLQEAVRLLNSVIGAKSEPDGLSGVLVKKGSLRKCKYAVRIKESLDGILLELIEWHSLFDPSWYLLARFPDADIDQGIESHLRDEAVRLLAGLRKSVRDLSSEANMPSRPISTRDFLGERLPIKGTSNTTT